MFKLYANVAYTWQGLDIEVDKKKVVNTMIDFSNKFNHYYFMIIERENGTDKNIEITRNEEDFKKYLLHWFLLCGRIILENCCPPGTKNFYMEQML